MFRGSSHRCSGFIHAHHSVPTCCTRPELISSQSSRLIVTKRNEIDAWPRDKTFFSFSKRRASVGSSAIFARRGPDMFRVVFVSASRAEV
jgi:hypothetical protein